MLSVDQIVVWIVVGLLGGTLAGFIATRRRRGYGFVRNLAVGLAGALVGGALIRAFGLFAALDRVAISLRDIVAAVIGSLIVLIGLWVWGRLKRAP